MATSERSYLANPVFSRYVPVQIIRTGRVLVDVSCPIYTVFCHPPIHYNKCPPHETAQEKVKY